MAGSSEVIIVGAGHSGLALSHFLSAQGRPHLILERGEIGESWRGRWDSFCLVTPNWTVRLPGQSYQGDDPDGFMPRDAFVSYLEDYASTFDAPVSRGIAVQAVSCTDGGFDLDTGDGTYRAANVVVAGGHYGHPKRPALAAAFPAEILQTNATAYRNAGDLPEGAVLVVGSGQTGCQIAEELMLRGRRVYLCVGRAGRLPRRYRGRDILCWQQRMGYLDRTPDMLDSPAERFRGDPHLSGRDGGRALSLHDFARKGMELLGSLQGVDGWTIALGDDLAENMRNADNYADRSLLGIDTYIERKGIDAPEPDSGNSDDGGPRGPLPNDPPRTLDLRDAGIGSVIWATGFDFDFGWIGAKVFDSFGFPIQKRGATDVPGLYFLGLNWMYKRKSGIIYGAGDDAAYVAEHIRARAEGRTIPDPAELGDPVTGSFPVFIPN